MPYSQVQFPIVTSKSSGKHVLFGSSTKKCMQNPFLFAIMFMSEATPFTPPYESRASFAWCFPKKYPLRLSGLDRDVLSDIMEQNSNARGQPGRSPSCMSYMDFAQEMKAALASLSADDSQHPWAAYMMPVWSDFVCFVSLQVPHPLNPLVTF